jgi:hypothetical protein
MKRATLIGVLMLTLGALSSPTTPLSVAQLRRDPFGSPRPEAGPPPLGPSRTLKMRKESFEQTQKDTEELYQLAAELKAEMENTTEDVLSVTVMKKAETIEKLAEKIKNRMKNL